MLALFIFVGSIAGIVAAVRVASLGDELRRLKSGFDALKRAVGRIEKQFGIGDETARPEKKEAPAAGKEKAVAAAVGPVEAGKAKEAAAAKPVESLKEPAAPKASKEAKAPALPAAKLKVEKEEEKAEVKVAAKRAEKAEPLIGPEAWKKFEDMVGKRWTTWVGAVVLFLGVGLFVKYAFDHGWVNETARVILGVVFGLALVGGGVRFTRRDMRALGQGVVGAGLSILYVSLFAAYDFYGLLPQPVTFILMAVVTAGGMTLAVKYDALATAFLAILGGLLTPVMLRTGVDPRDALFAYLLMLDVGVLGAALFRRWRALDVLAFVGTAAYFTLWHWKFYRPEAAAPAMLWLSAFYVVFLLQPFVYHLRKGTAIVGERFILAVSNAVGMFLMAYRILHYEHKYVLGLVVVGMSAAYLVMGSRFRKRVDEDKRSVFGFVTLSVMYLVIAFAILFDLHAVTIAWAIKAPVLLYLAYKYDYLPVRIGCLVPLVLAAGRIFTVQWPMHEAAFLPVLNRDFGTAIFVALCGWAYSIVQHWKRADSKAVERVLKICVGVASGFLALTVMHIEVWDWLGLSGRVGAARWAASLVWTVGAGGFLAAGLRLRSVEARLSGFGALAAAAYMIVWAFAPGSREGVMMFANGRLLAAVAGILMVFGYGFAYRFGKERCEEWEQEYSPLLFGLGILLAALAFSVETWQWLTFREHYYAARCVLPFIWAAAAGAHVGTGLRLRALGLRGMALLLLVTAGMMAATGYGYRHEKEVEIFLNWRFAAGLGVALMAFLHGFLLRMWSKLRAPEEEALPAVLYGAGILAMAALLTAETSLWLGAREQYYLSRSMLPFIWAAGAAAYIGTGIRLRSMALRGIAIVMMIVAGVMAAVGYGYRCEHAVTIFVNWRFAAGLGVAAVVFLHAWLLRVFRKVCDEAEEAVSILLHGVGIMALVILGSSETWLWLRAHGHEYLAGCLSPLIWVGGSAAYLVSGIRLRAATLRSAGSVVAVVAGLLALFQYAAETGVSILYLNGRFGAGAAAALMLFGAGFVLRRLKERSENERLNAKVLYGITLVFLFVLLSFETYLHFIRSIGDAERARWEAQMALSVVWGVYAAAVLLLGFWRKVRGVRLSALALFMVTALKVVLVDMAKVKEAYRIVSFVVLGVLLIGASYLYHRVEKWLEASSGVKEPEEEKEKPPE